MFPKTPMLNMELNASVPHLTLSVVGVKKVLVKLKKAPIRINEIIKNHIILVEASYVFDFTP